MAGLGLVQFGDELVKVGGPFEIRPVGPNIMFYPLLAACNCEQLAVQGNIPFPVEAKLPKCGIEGRSMAVSFRVGKGAVHVEKQGVQGHGVRSN